MSVPEVLSGADPSKGRHNEESKAAWEKARHSARNVRERILEGMWMLESAGWKTGLTPKEFARWVGKPLHAISGRFGDLAALGLIRRTPNVRDGSRAWELGHPDRRMKPSPLAELVELGKPETEQTRKRLPGHDNCVGLCCTTGALLEDFWKEVEPDADCY